MATSLYRLSQPTTAPLLVIVVLALANFMQVLDQSIANVSIPAITGDLGTAPSQGAWIITSYSISNAIMVPLTGWIAKRWGQVRVFALATALFTLTSLFCGIAWSLPSLIVFRVMQGAAGGIMIPLAQALLMGSAPAGKRGMALALWSMTTVIAPIAGPLLGGWITDNFHWSWIFLINVPVGLIAAAAVWQLLRHRETELRRRPLDRVGVLLLVVWVGLLQVVLDKGHELDWFESPFITALAVIIVVAFALFMVWELTERHPIVDLTLLTRRNFVIGVLALSLSFCAFRAGAIILPLWLQTQVGYTALWAGYVLAPSGIMALLLGPLAGRNIERAPRLLASGAIAIHVACMAWRAQFTDSADFYTFALPNFVQGIAMAFFFAPLVSISLGGIEPGRLAAAAGLQNFIRNLLGSFGTSLSITFWERREALHRTQLAERVTDSAWASGDYVARLGGVGVPADQAHGFMDKVLTQQAYTLASNDIYWVTSSIMFSIIVLVWFARPPFGRAAAPSAEPE